MIINDNNTTNINDIDDIDDIGAELRVREGVAGRPGRRQGTGAVPTALRRLLRRLVMI